MGNSTTHGANPNGGIPLGKPRRRHHPGGVTARRVHHTASTPTGIDTEAAPLVGAPSPCSRSEKRSTVRWRCRNPIGGQVPIRSKRGSALSGVACTRGIWAGSRGLDCRTLGCAFGTGRVETPTHHLRANPQHSETTTTVDGEKRRKITERYDLSYQKPGFRQPLSESLSGLARAGCRSANKPRRVNSRAGLSPVMGWRGRVDRESERSTRRARRNGRGGVTEPELRRVSPISPPFADRTGRRGPDRSIPRLLTRIESALGTKSHR